MPEDSEHDVGEGIDGDTILYLPSSSSSTRTTCKQRSNIPSLVAALSAAMTTGGTTYAFGLYGNDLKKSLSLSASEIDTISTAFFFAGLLSWLPGLSADRFGTKFSIATGGITGATALMTYWFVATKLIQVERSLLVPVLSLLGVSIFLSCAMITGSVFKIIVSCCGPGTKGSAVGVAKGLVGLGSGAYACIFSSIRTRNETNLDFLLLAAFFALVSATIPALLLLPSKAQVDRDVMRDDATPQHFRILFSSLGIMAVLIVWDSLASLSRRSAENETDDQDEEDDMDGAKLRHIPMALFFVAVWWLPIASLLCLPRRQDAHHHARLSLVDEDQDGDNDQPNIRDGAEGFGLRRDTSDTSRGDISMKRAPTELPEANDVSERSEDDGLNEDRSLLHVDRGPGSPLGVGTPAAVNIRNVEQEPEENMNLIQLLQTPSAWLMLWTTTILVGAGTVETNNMGEMVEALGLPSRVTSSSLALFSVAQAVGRVVTGAVSESALNWNTKRFLIDNGIPRPFFLVLASCIAVISHLMLGLASRQFIFVLGSMLSGAAFGMVWPLMVLIVGEVFGTANAGANYMFYDGFSSAVGTLLLTKGLAQHVYEVHSDSDSSTCHGRGCFQLTHVLVAVASLTCVVTSLGLLYSSRHTYNKRSLHRS